MSSVNKLSLILLSALFLSACDATVPQPVTDGNATIPPSATSPVIDLGSASGTDILVRGISTIEGDITLHNSTVASGDVEVNVSARNTEASTSMQSDGTFVLEVPLSEIAQTVILDFEGPNVVPATVSLAIPAEADRVLLDVNIAVRTPSITFSLDRGGVMTNSLRLSGITARKLTAEIDCLAIQTEAETKAEAETAAAAEREIAKADAEAALDEEKAALEAEAEAKAAELVDAQKEKATAEAEANHSCGDEKIPADTRVSVEVPPNAFEFADGTLATGNGEVSITEINIEDLAGSGSWAPNLFGLAEQASEEVPLTTLGMTDFYFSQDGQPLQLRPGMSANISTDMLTTVVIPNGQTTATQVTAGMAIPLWYYDTADMVWKEQGESIVIADSNSQTGFTLSGDVSHFSMWNHDYPTPRTNINVTVVLVDVGGQPYTDLSVASVSIVGSVDTSQGVLPNGNPWSYPSNWVVTENIVGNQSFVPVAAGNLSGIPEVTMAVFNEGSTTMTFTASNIVTTGEGTARLQSPATTKTKTFDNNSFDNSLVIEVVMVEQDPIPITVPATVIIELVDLAGNVRDDLNVSGYRVSTQSPTGGYQTNLTPTDNTMNIQDLTQAEVDNGQTITYEFTLDNLFIQGLGEFNLLFPVTETLELTSIGGSYTITLQVPVIDL